MSSDFDQQNPYASPLEAASLKQPILTREEAFTRLRTPLIGRRYAAAFSALYGLGACILVWYVEFISRRRRISPGDWADALAGIGISITMILLSVLVLYASNRILHGYVRTWIWVAIVCGLIPINGPCGIQMFFAFWMLHLMVRQDIRTALMVTMDSNRDLPSSL